MYYEDSIKLYGVTVQETVLFKLRDVCAVQHLWHQFVNADF
jgi:hypothetical protein